MTFLLDVNVLIALIDPEHIDHDTAHAWFAALSGDGWATCPIVENGVVRIVSHPSYPMEPGPGAPAKIAGILKRLRELPGHVFWQTISASLTIPSSI